MVTSITHRIIDVQFVPIQISSTNIPMNLSTTDPPKKLKIVPAMNLKKINHLLALAFQNSEGPFEVIVKYDNGTSLSGSMTKERISTLSEKESVVEIKIGTRLTNRRKTERPGYKDRRWDSTP